MNGSYQSWNDVLAAMIIDWKYYNLGELFNHRKDSNHPELPLLSVTGNGGIVRRDTLEKRDTSNADKSKYLRVLPGDIAYNTMRMWQGVSGKSEIEGIASPAYTICEPREDILSDYAKFLFKLPYLVQVFHRNSQGLVNDTLNLKFNHFAPIIVKIPPLPEQKKIASILTSVDNVIEKTEAQISKLQDLKKGMMNELLTMGIGHSEFKDSPVGRIPVEWKVVNCGQVCKEIVVGIVVKPTQYYQDDGIPALRSANVREEGLNRNDLKFISEESNEILVKSKLQRGDVVSVRTGYPGTTAVVTDEFTGCNCIDLIISRPSEQVDSSFLSLWINSDFGKGQVLKAQGGLAQQHFNVGDMKKMIIVLPPMDEQRKIVDFHAAATQRLSCVSGKLSSVRSLKKALMNDLLTGKKRVTVIN